MGAAYLGPNSDLHTTSVILGVLINHIQHIQGPTDKTELRKRNHLAPHRHSSLPTRNTVQDWGLTQAVRNFQIKLWRGNEIPPERKKMTEIYLDINFHKLLLVSFSFN